MQLHTKMQFKEVGMCTCMAMGKMQTVDLQIVQWLTCRWWCGQNPNPNPNHNLNPGLL